jgi:hypothetical protein
MIEIKSWSPVDKDGLSRKRMGEEVSKVLVGKDGLPRKKKSTRKCVDAHPK